MHLGVLKFSAFPFTWSVRKADVEQQRAAGVVFVARVRSCGVVGWRMSHYRDSHYHDGNGS